MHTDWKPLYQVAMREQNDMKFEELYELVRHAVHSRLLELGESGLDTRERRAPDKALRQLAIPKHKLTWLASCFHRTAFMV